MDNTNEKNNSLLFNPSLKIRFLSEVRESTRQSYERIFRITQKFESALNKDINLFTEKQLDVVLYGFKAKNRNTIESYARIVSSYLNWSLNMGLTPINHLSKLRPDDFEKYIINEEEYITEQKLRRYEDLCENFQDGVILRLLFIGVGGKQLSEIRNLKKTDIDFERMEIKLTNSLKEDEHGRPIKSTERYLKIDERTAYLLRGAIKSETYVKRNGMMEERDNVRTYTDLVNNDYVLRPSITRTEHFDTPVDKYVIYRRINVLSETLNIDLTAKFIQRSGMIYLAKNLTKGDEVLLDDLKIIADRFNIKS